MAMSVYRKAAVDLIFIGYFFIIIRNSKFIGYLIFFLTLLFIIHLLLLHFHFFFFLILYRIFFSKQDENIFLIEGGVERDKFVCTLIKNGYVGRWCILTKF